MLLCIAPEFIAWQPDFSSSEQANPDWTKLLYKGIQLSNAINALSWDEAVEALATFAA